MTKFAKKIGQLNWKKEKNKMKEELPDVQESSFFIGKTVHQIKGENNLI